MEAGDGAPAASGCSLPQLVRASTAEKERKRGRAPKVCTIKDSGYRVIRLGTGKNGAKKKRKFSALTV
jgi:hypothetical protein